jgi:hypothetical protein
MNYLTILTAGACLYFPSMPSVAERDVSSGQSLAEVARKEKERREKNKADQRQVLIITENDLPQPSAPTSSHDESELPPTAPSLWEANGGSSRSAEINQTANSDVIDETSAPSEISLDAPLEDRLKIFQQMLAAHKVHIQRIDGQIERNKARLIEIEQDLGTLSVGGLLPVAPRANQQFYPGDIIALATERQQLIEDNEHLQAQKKTMTDELKEKGRRAGIPPGYRRF